MVNGQVVDKPQVMVSPQEKIELHPEASLAPVAPVTMLFHQPFFASMDANSAQQHICAATRTADDPSGIHIVKQHFARLKQGTPLEKNASGLLVFTQDLRVTRKLIDDAITIEQEYIVETTGEMPPDGLRQLSHGLSFNGRALSPIKVSWQNETRLRFALKGAQPGQITHMCKSVGLQVLAMKRIRIGRISMAKLQPGLWRYLMPHERF